MEGEDSAGGGEVKLNPDDASSEELEVSDSPPKPDPRAFNQKKVWRRRNHHLGRACDESGAGILYF